MKVYIERNGFEIHLDLIYNHTVDKYHIELLKN